jgi:hypothetical protein
MEVLMNRPGCECVAQLETVDGRTFCPKCGQEYVESKATVYARGDEIRPMPGEPETD